MSGCYVVFHKQLGDLLLLEPALAKLREHHGEPVKVMTRNGHRALISLMEGVSYLMGPPLMPRTHLYCFDPLSKSAVRSLFAPVLSRRCILPEKREMEWIHPFIFGRVIVPELGEEYIAKYFWEHTPVPAHSPFRLPRLNQPPDSWKPRQVEDDSFVLVNPTSGWRKKSWVAEEWVATLQALHERVQKPIIMTSAATDWQVEHCREIARQCGSWVQYLGSETSLENFLWLCARASLVLTVDGAASHFAQAFGVPSLTLFGPTSLGNWHSSTAKNLAVQAPPSEDGIRRMRNLRRDAVLESLSALAG